MRNRIFEKFLPGGAKLQKPWIITLIPPPILVMPEVRKITTRSTAAWFNDGMTIVSIGFCTK
jgi:hypothetical protein